MEGMESKILFKDDNDYDSFIKILFVIAYKKMNSVVEYCVVSNHAHYVILSDSYYSATDFGDETKRIYSMHFNKKYGETGILRRCNTHCVLLDSDRYLRNALAYDLRNALDNGAENINEYRWSSFRAMFCNGRIVVPTRKVRELTRDEIRGIMHTHNTLKDVDWVLNANNELEPASTCNWKYLEKAFLNDNTFFLKTLGVLNTSEVKQLLIDNPKERKNDQDMLKSANDISHKWYQLGLNELPIEKKARLLLYVYRSYRTTPNQMARVFELGREKVLSLLHKKQ
jgi:REP element-mobilizing transposase RayT